MAISVEKSKIVPAIDYKYVHLNEFNVKLQKQDDGYTKYKIFVDIIFYALVDGKKVFDPASRREVEVEDFQQMAIDEAEKGNLNLVNLMNEFEGIVARYIQYTMDVGLTTIETA